MGKNRKVVIRLGALVLVMLLFGWLLARSFRDLEFESIAWSPWNLLVAAILLQCGMIVNVLLLQFVFRFLKAPVPFHDAYNVYFVSNLARYIPGRVWQLMALTHLARRRGIKILESSTLFVINQLLVILGGFLFVAIFGLLFSNMSTLTTYISLLPIVPLFILLIYPPSLVRFMNIGLKMIGRKTISYKLTRRYALSVISFVFFSFSLTGFGFIWLARGIGLSIHDFFYMFSIYPLAYLLGYLSLITPGGVGIRESIIIFLLKNQYSSQMSALLGLMAFIWFLSVEFTNSVVALISIRDYPADQVE